jgi:hypothetical protein
MIDLPVRTDPNQEGVLELVGTVVLQMLQQRRPRCGLFQSTVSMKETESFLRDNHIYQAALVLPVVTNGQSFFCRMGLKNEDTMWQGLLQSLGKDLEKQVVGINHQDGLNLSSQ